MSNLCAHDMTCIFARQPSVCKLNCLSSTAIRKKQSAKHSPNVRGNSGGWSHCAMAKYQTKIKLSETRLRLDLQAHCTMSLVSQIFWSLSVYSRVTLPLRNYMLNLVPASRATSWPFNQRKHHDGQWLCHGHGHVFSVSLS